MSSINLTQRSRQAELMDAPDVDPHDLDHAMRHLEIINRLLNGYGPTIAGIERLLTEDAQTFTLLDVGCGSGDTLRHIARWSRRREIPCRLTGIELSPRSAERAAEACKDYPEISVQQQDVFDIPATDKYDIVHCALVLHHFPENADVVRVLAHMQNLSRLGVVVNDLHRHRAAYESIRLLTRMCSRSPILQNDAPLSVARGFTRAELLTHAEKAGLPQVRVDWHWAFRWLMTSSYES